MTDPRIGTILDGRYKIVDELAAGGMGVVYRGERLGLGRSVAIKFLHAHIAADKSFRERFAREAKAMGQLQHPHCAAVIDFGFHDQEPYVVMDLVAGESLRSLLDRGRLPGWRAIGIMRQILSGLAHAHALGITHRDIKPDNVMVDGTGAFGDQVRILDFGLAKLRQSTSELTTGFVVGTPSYMAPEQTLALPVDERTDIYAAGIVLFEMLTGQKPFRADEAIEVLRMHRETPPPRLGRVAPDVRFSEELESALMQSLAKDPGHRFSSAAAFATALDHVPEAATRPGSSPLTATPNTPVPALTRPSAQGAAMGPAMGHAPTEWSQAPAAQPGGANATEFLGTGQIEMVEAGQKPASRGRDLPGGANATEFLGTGQIEMVPVDRKPANRGRDLPGGAVTVPGGGPVPHREAPADRYARAPFTDPSIDPPSGMAGPPAGMRAQSVDARAQSVDMHAQSADMRGTTAQQRAMSADMHGATAQQRAMSAGMHGATAQQRAMSAGMPEEPSRAFTQGPPGRSRKLWIGIALGTAMLSLLVIVGLLGDGEPGGSAGTEGLATAAGEDLVVEYDPAAEGAGEPGADGDSEGAGVAGEDALAGEAGDGALAEGDLDAADTGDAADAEGVAQTAALRDPARAGVKSANQVPAGSSPLAQAQAYLAQGQTRRARDLLEKLRRQDRDNPEIHYWLGRSYFKELWVEDGLEAYRDAIALDPGYRSKADLIESAATGLGNDSNHGAVARFLVRDIGRPAKTALQSIASGHHREEVRERASRALRQIR